MSESPDELLKFGITFEQLLKEFNSFDIAARGDIECDYDTAMKCRRGGDYDNYFVIMTHYADRNCRMAIECLENDYENEINLKQNHTNTIKYYEMNVDKSYSCAHLAYMYMYGYGVIQDYAKAIELLVYASRKGNNIALCNLGKIYYRGNYDGITKNNMKAIKLFEAASDRGYSRAMCNLGNMYVCKRDMMIDYHKAYTIYQKAIDKGSLFAMRQIGHMHRHGYSVARDYAKAFEFYQKVADMGNVDAICDLGCIMAMHRLTYLHANGIGMEQNHVKAIDLCKEYIKKKIDIGLDPHMGFDALVQIYQNMNEKCEKDVVTYFLSLGKPMLLKQIFNYSDFIIASLQEKYILDQENKKLHEKIISYEAHINASPDGKLFFENLEM